MTDLKAKLDVLSAKATQGDWVADGLAICLVDEPADWNGAERDNVALMVELVNAYRTGQLIVDPVWQDISSASDDECASIILWNGERVLTGSPWEGGFSDHFMDWIEPHPTHWMPLPTPPAGE